MQWANGPNGKDVSCWWPSSYTLLLVLIHWRLSLDGVVAIMLLIMPSSGCTCMGLVADNG